MKRRFFHYHSLCVLIKWLDVWGIAFIHQMKGSCHQDGPPPPLSKFSVRLTTVQSIKVASFVFAFYCISDHLTPCLKALPAMTLCCSQVLTWGGVDRPLPLWAPPPRPYSLAQVLPAWACIPSVPLPLTPLWLLSVLPLPLDQLYPPFYQSWGSCPVGKHSLTLPRSFLAPYSFPDKL